MSLSRVDKLIKKLSTIVIDKKQPNISLNIDDLLWLCDQSISILQKDEILLKIKAPINIVGDIHGQFNDLLRFLELGFWPPTSNYLFLGDYVDRGQNSIETFTLLLCLKVKFPNNVWLLRGNHETPEISKLYGFFAECATRYNQNLWIKFTEVFKYLSIAAIISDRIFCVHGGLSPQLTDISIFSEMKRPLDISGSAMLTDLLWSDPSSEHSGFQESSRGTSFTFGADVVEEFNKKYEFDLICRAHQIVEPGFDFPYYPNRSLVTVFSASNYCDFGNRGSILKVEADLKCTFLLIDPPPQERKRFMFRLLSHENRYD